MATEMRTERTIGRKAGLREDERASLVAMATMPGYVVLLDILEEQCILQETRLINCPVDDHARIIAEHTMAKAFWQVFTGVQKRVQEEKELYSRGDLQVPDEEVEVVLTEEMAADAILQP